MKDSFGGTFMLYIMLIFFVIFVCLLAAAINLSKTFRVKNVAINYLEHYSYNEAISKIGSISGYNVSNDGKAGEHCNGVPGDTREMKNGVCVVKVPQSLGDYYKVFSYIVMDLPLFHISILIPIGGETKTIIG